MLKILIAAATLLAAPALAQNTGTVRQPSGAAGPTGTVQQPQAQPSAGPANYGATLPMDRSAITRTPGGTADNEAQPSGTEFHQMLPAK